MYRVSQNPMISRQVLGNVFDQRFCWCIKDSGIFPFLAISEAIKETINRVAAGFFLVEPGKIYIEINSYKISESRIRFFFRIPAE